MRTRDLERKGRILAIVVKEEAQLHSLMADWKWGMKENEKWVVGKAEGTQWHLLPGEHA